MHSLERKYNPANRSRFQHFLHGLLFHTGKYHKSAVIIGGKCELLAYTCTTISVPRRQRQVLVHAGPLLVRRLLHNPSLLRLDLPGQDMDR